MIKILFVCLGNICRSPLAEAIFNKKAADKGLKGEFEVDSSGIGPWHIGKDPDPRSIEIAAKHGIKIEHKGRQFSSDDSHYDYIMAMDSSNLNAILQLLDTNHDGIYLMRHFDSVEKGTDVPDPYYGGNEGFQHVYDILSRSCDEFISFLKEKHKL